MGVLVRHQGQGVRGEAGLRVVKDEVVVVDVSPVAGVPVDEAHEDLLSHDFPEVDDPPAHGLEVPAGGPDQELLVIGLDDLHAGRLVVSAADQEAGPGMGHAERDRRERTLGRVLVDLVAAGPVLSLVPRSLLAPLDQSGVALDRHLAKGVAVGDPVLEAPRLEAEVEGLSVVAEGRDPRGVPGARPTLSETLHGPPVGSGPGGEVLAPVRPTSPVDVDPRSRLVADDHVDEAVSVHVASHHLGADAGVAVDEKRHELCALLAPHRLEPVEDCRASRVGVVTVVSPVALARDQVLDAVAVHVDQSHGVGLRERDRVLAGLGRRARSRIHDGVRDERDLAVTRDLLEPVEPVPVSLRCSDDVVIPVAVEVVREHLRPAGAVRREIVGVLLPEATLGVARGVLPPAASLEDVLPAVAIDVPHAHAVGEALVVSPRRHGVELPGLRGVLRVRGGPAPLPLGVKDELPPAVPGHVDVVGGLVVDAIEHLVPGPVSRLSPRVLEPGEIRSGKADDQDVVPAVPVDVVHPGEEVVRVAVLAEGGDRIELVPVAEVRAGVPERSRDDVSGTVPVEVAEVSTLPEEDVREPKRLEGVDVVFLCRQDAA